MNPEEVQVAEEWTKAFESLPKERQADVGRWMTFQVFVIENLGISPEEWFGYVQWAIDNLFDYSFIEEYAETGDYERTNDRTELGDSTDLARAMVGSKAAKNVATGEGIQRKRKAEGIEKELFNRFMNQHLGTMKK